MNLKSNVEWFNNLDEDKKWYSLRYLFRKENHTELTKQERNKLNNLEVETKHLIDKGKDKNQVLKKLVSLGLNRKTANKLYNNALNHRSYIADVRLINLIDDDLFDDFISFLFDDYYLIGRYEYVYIRPFTNLDKFPKTEHANRISNVVQRELIMILKRCYLISTLKSKLLNEFQLSTGKTEIFINKIKNNIDELEKAYIIKSLMAVELKLNSVLRNNKIEDPLENFEMDKIVESIYKNDIAREYKDKEQALMIKYLINMDLKLNLFLNEDN
ncbi:hypothetical protein SAMN04488598_1434 [Halanaerobium congolense]|uniref:Uncharacterized protein n=1 Tax=Halanaerobium congolense TaxID=54121 RepID=A0A1I0CG66_9FIRM|nr:hypothetical protein [Halanaerobium congolense]PTX14792.1 hypothetical protein C7953_2854 [Halanaerobium congolense]SDG06742.1 hypothetical protein SAMN04488598_1434 [Halanaerobium congolense]SET18072.1 hypothetical protein SAMN04515652_13523 [Halanaerobium congolense]SFP68145.1 hypothetical protein SAMN04488596_13923 [Halanaerobium congolense]